MRAEGARLARRLAALALAVATAGTTAAQEPAYVRRLVLPVAEDAIGYPPGVTADLHTGEVFVCDARMNRVLVFDSEGLFLHEMPGGDAFTGPQDVAVDPDGRLVVAASHERHPAVVELDFDGLFLREIRLSGLPDGAAEPHVGSLAVSPRGDRLYLLDQTNLRVWISDRDGAVRASIDLAAGLSAREARDLITGHVDVYGETVLEDYARMIDLAPGWDALLDTYAIRHVLLRPDVPLTEALRRGCGWDVTLEDEISVLLSRPAGAVCP